MPPASVQEIRGNSSAQNIRGSGTMKETQNVQTDDMSDDGSEPVASESPRYIDSRVPRFNQTVLAIALLASFITRFFWIVPVMCAVLLAGVIGGPRANPVMAFFIHVVKPRLKPPHKLEDPRPPRFAAALGSIFLGLATLLWLAGIETAAWVLTVIVAILAAIASVFELCLGCEIYVAIMRWRGRLTGPWKAYQSAD
jgi:hypothetical protein